MEYVNLQEKINDYRNSWTQHTERMQDNRLTKRIFFTHKDEENLGRPNKREVNSWNGGVTDNACIPEGEEVDEEEEEVAQGINWWLDTASDREYPRTRVPTLAG